MSEQINDNQESKVGYGNPPKKGQFQKGKSGNPSGKRKVSPNGNDLFQTAMQERVAIQEGGKTIFLTRKHIAVRKRVEESAKGNMSALRELLKLGREAETGEAGGKPLVLHVDLVRATGVPLEYTLNDENTVIIRLPKPGTGEGSGAVRAEGSATGQVRRRRRKATEPSSQTFRR